MGLVLLVAAALGVPRLTRLAVSLVALVGFVVLVSPEPSVLRAAVMAGVVLVGLAVGRPAHGLPLLATAVVVLLVADPWLARQYAFSLSVLATAGLIVLTEPLAAVLSRMLPEPVALTIAVPVAAQLAVQPLLLALDPGIPLYSLVANVLAEPAAPLATVVGLAACLVGPLSPVFASTLAHVAWAPAAWIAAVARFMARLPFGSLSWEASWWGVAALVGLVCLIAAAILITPFRPARRLAAIGVLALVTPLGGVAVGGEVGRPVSQPTDWQFTQCDVGQGDAVLVRSEGAVALVDTGDDEGLLTDCLELAGVGRLDLLVLTHFDRDHVGAAGVLAGRVDHVAVGPSDGASADRLVDVLRGSGAEVTEAQVGWHRSLGRLDLTALWPPPRASPGNDASIALEVTPQPGCPSTCLTGLLLGDLDEIAQRRLLARSNLSATDVVKVSHHGSADQSAALYRAVEPRVALIGVGAENAYGHPRAPTLRLLEGLGSRVERSDLLGTVMVSGSDDGTMDVWSHGVGRSL